MQATLTPPSMGNVKQYHPVSVAILRPQISWYGPRFAVCHPPPVPIAIGTNVDLKVFYFNHGDDHPSLVQYAVDTTVKGTVFAVESVAPESIEFVIHNDGPGHPYAYLIVPRDKPHITAPLPFRVRVALFLLCPYTHCTYWRENNVQSVDAGRRELRTRVGAAPTERPPTPPESTDGVSLVEPPSAFSDE